MRKLFFISILFLFVSSSYGQAVQDYIFSSQSGTFNQISGAHAPNSGGSNDGNYNNIPIGFNFNYCGIIYTSLAANTNGWISLGHTVSFAFYNNSLFGGGVRPVLAPLWDDLDIQDTGNFSYITSGISPNQVFTAQWYNAKWNKNATGACISFQVKLYETSNIIEFVYRPESGSVNTATASIGITAVAIGNNNYLSLDGTGTAPLANSAVETSTLNTKPASGQIYRFTPCSCAKPISVNATSTTTTSAIIDWTGTGTQWQIQYGSPGFTLGSGTNIFTNSKPCTLSVLNSGTVYQLYMRKICAAGDTSAWSYPYKFVTSCSTFNLPYIQNFDGISYDSIPLCMSVSNDNIDEHNWFMNSSIYHTAPRSMRIRWNYVMDMDDWFYTPGLNLSAGVQYILEFYYCSSGSQYPERMEVKFGTSPDAAGMTTQVWNDTSIINSSYQLGTTIFSPASSGVYYLGFHGYSHPAMNFISVDDIMFYMQPTCLKPSALAVGGITVNSAAPGWTENNNATNWQIQYGIEGFTLGSGTMVTTNNNPHTLSNLNSATNYQFFVRSICTAGDTSFWAGPFSFMTSCPGYDIPYTENFDALSIHDVPLCMTVLNNNYDDQLWETTDLSAYSPPNAMGIGYNDLLAMNDWFFTPPLIFYAGMHYRVQFYYGNDGDITWPEKLEVLWGDNPNDATMSGGQIFSDTNIITAFLQGNSSVMIAPYTGLFYVGFHGFSNADEDLLVVDDISVAEVLFNDVAVAQSNVLKCDTLGWYYPPITFTNTGSDTIRTGDTIIASYNLAGAGWITDTFLVLSDFYPDALQTYTFAEPVHFNQFTDYNCSYAVSFQTDQVIANDSVDFTWHFGSISVNLGADTTICINYSTTLDAGFGFDSYLWSTGDTARYLLVDTSSFGMGPHPIWVQIDQGNCSDLDTIVISILPCTGVNEIEEAACRIFPNPSSGRVRIEIKGMTGEIEMFVVNLQGQKVYSDNFEMNADRLIEDLDMSFLDRGIYCVMLQDRSKRSIQKLVIE